MRRNYRLLSVNHGRTTRKVRINEEQRRMEAYQRWEKKKRGEKLKTKTIPLSFVVEEIVGPKSASLRQTAFAPAFQVFYHSIMLVPCTSFPEIAVRTSVGKDRINIHGFLCFAGLPIVVTIRHKKSRNTLKNECPFLPHGKKAVTAANSHVIIYEVLFLLGRGGAQAASNRNAFIQPKHLFS